MPAFTGVIGTANFQPGNIMFGTLPIVNVLVGHVLVFTDGKKFHVDYLNQFGRCIPLLGLSDDSQGERALLHAMLQMCNRYQDDPDDIELTPLHAALARMREVRINPNAYDRIAEIFNGAMERLSRR